MTSTLSAQGISYELQNNGTAIAVQSNQSAKARVALAGANLLSGSTQPDFSLFEKQNLGESNFHQQVTYQRALQGQLAETIDSVQGVSGARSSSCCRTPRTRSSAKARAPPRPRCCCRGDQLARAERGPGIAQLVSSSVPGLQLSKVTITDASGAAAVAAAGSGARRRRPRASRRPSRATTRTTAASLDAMLAQTLGVGQGAGARLRQHERRSDDQGIARIRQGRRARCTREDAGNADRDRQRERVARPAPRTSPRQRRGPRAASPTTSTKARPRRSA